MNLLLVVLTWAIAGNCAAACTNVKSKGHFSSLQWTNDADPHLVGGYAVRLYQCEKVIFGEVRVANGSSESVGGRLYDVNLNAATGRLSFKAKYADGEELNKFTGPQGREARTLLSFSGTLTNRSIKGVFALRDAYGDRGRDEHYRQELKRERDYTLPKSQEEFERDQPIPAW